MRSRRPLEFLPDRRKGVRKRRSATKANLAMKRSEVNAKLRSAVHSDKPVIDRFWSLVEKTEVCWLWKGPFDGRNANPKFCVGHSITTMAHRFAYELETGKELPKGSVLKRLCDTPRCVRPKHYQVQHRTNKGTKRGWIKNRTVRLDPTQPLPLPPEVQASLVRLEDATSVAIAKLKALEDARAPGGDDEEPHPDGSALEPITEAVEKLLQQTTRLHKRIDGLEATTQQTLKVLQALHQRVRHQEDGADRAADRLEAAVSSLEKIVQEQQTPQRHADSEGDNNRRPLPRAWDAVGTALWQHPGSAEPPADYNEFLFVFERPPVADELEHFRMAKRLVSESGAPESMISDVAQALPKRLGRAPSPAEVLVVVQSLLSQDEAQGPT